MKQLEINSKQEIHNPPIQPFQPKLVRSLVENFQDKTWFYRTMYKPTSKFGTKYLKDHFCYNCKGSFAVERKEDYDSVPIIYHKQYLKRKAVKDRWGFNEWKNYSEAWCCHCYSNRITQEAKKENSDITKRTCDCGVDLNKEINKYEEDLKETEEKKKQLTDLIFKLATISRDAYREKKDYLAEESNDCIKYRLNGEIESLDKDINYYKIKIERNKEWLQSYVNYMNNPPINKPKNKH